MTGWQVEAVTTGGRDRRRYQGWEAKSLPKGTISKRRVSKVLADATLARS